MFTLDTNMISRIIGGMDGVADKSPSKSFTMSNWHLMELRFGEDEESYLTKTLYKAPNLGGQARYIYVESKYLDVVQIRWSDEVDSLLSLFN